MPSLLAKSAQVRRETPLCSEEFRLLHEQLPPALPPAWLRQGLIASLVLGFLVTLLLLVSPMDEFIVVPGVVRSGDSTLIFSRGTGLLESLEVTDGEVVEPGQVLARLDSAEARQALVELEAERVRTEIELKLARATQRKIQAAPLPAEFLFSEVEVVRQEEVKSLQEDYLQRMRELERSGAASGVELLNLRLQVIATTAMLERNRQALALLQGDFGQAAKEEGAERVHLAEARLAELGTRRRFLEENLARRVIRAPRGGVVSAMTPLFPGENVIQGTPLFSLSEEQGWELRLYPSEDRMDKIEPGQLVRFRSNNNPDRLAPLGIGRVDSVTRNLTEDDLRPDGRVAPAKGYRVTVEIEEVPYPLVWGASVEAEIVLGQRPFWRLLFLGD